MAELLTLVCDRKGKNGQPCPNEPSTYFVTFPDGSTWRADLCNVHSADLREVQSYGAAQAQPRPATGRKRMRKTAITPKT